MEGKKKKSHKNLSLVRRTKLFASGQGWELEIICWCVSRIKKMTFILQQHLLQILGSIIVCNVHIIVNKLLWWMEDTLKAERIVWIQTITTTIMYLFVTQTQRWQNTQSSHYRAKLVFFLGGGGRRKRNGDVDRSIQCNKRGGKMRWGYEGKKARAGKR